MASLNHQLPDAAAVGRQEGMIHKLNEWAAPASFGNECLVRKSLHSHQGQRNVKAGWNIWGIFNAVSHAKPLGRIHSVKKGAKDK